MDGVPAPILIFEDNDDDDDDDKIVNMVMMTVMNMMTMLIMTTQVPAAMDGSLSSDVDNRRR